METNVRYFAPPTGPVKTIQLADIMVKKIQRVRALAWMKYFLYVPYAALHE